MKSCCRKDEGVVRRWLPVLLALSAAAVVVAAIVLSPPASGSPLTRAEPSRVCMMTNKAFPTEQTPVPIRGKTYFGCCPMCAGRLARDAKLRAAVDPVSGRRVDKADAVIGVSKEGVVYYFENERNLRTFRVP